MPASTSIGPVYWAAPTNGGTSISSKQMQQLQIAEVFSQVRDKKFHRSHWDEETEINSKRSLNRCFNFIIVLGERAI